MKKIIGIGGSVIKTEIGEELKKRIDGIEIIIYNGGALFHDFQLALEGYTSVPISELTKSLNKIESSSLYLWDWLKGIKPAPEGSLARVCEDNNIPTLLFTGLACDYWVMFDDNWELLGKRAEQDFEILKKRFQTPFHYINMGSAVIHPEVFLKAMQGINHNNFTADAVDFKDMYRPKTRVTKIEHTKKLDKITRGDWGTYYKMDFKEYIDDHWKINKK